MVQAASGEICWINYEICRIHQNFGKSYIFQISISEQLPEKLYLLQIPFRDVWSNYTYSTVLVLYISPHLETQSNPLPLIAYGASSV